jgi:hypothetical protein
VPFGKGGFYWSTQNVPNFAQELCWRSAGFRTLNLGGDDDETSAPMGSTPFTSTATLAQLEHDSNREHIVGAISKRPDAGTNLDGNPAESPTSSFRRVERTIEHR